MTVDLVDYCLSKPEQEWTAGELTEFVYKRATESTLKMLKCVFSLARVKLMDDHEKLVLPLKEKGKIRAYKFAGVEDSDAIALLLARRIESSGRFGQRTKQLAGIVEKTGLLPAARVRELVGTALQ